MTVTPSRLYFPTNAIVSFVTFAHLGLRGIRTMILNVLQQHASMRRVDVNLRSRMIDEVRGAHHIFVYSSLIYHKIRISDTS